MGKYAKPRLKLDDRLNTYTTTVRTSAAASALKRTAEKWPIYATVTGAALAMASNASASIIYSGLLDSTVSLGSKQKSANRTTGRSVLLKSGSGAPIGSFQLVVAHHAGSGIKGAVIGVGGSQLNLLGSSELLARLSSGAAISGAAATGSNFFGTGFRFVDYERIFSTSRHTYGWSKTKGFGGFSFFNSVTDQKDYGWIRLQYGIGKNDLINSLTAVDWAYDDSGAAILAGDTGLSSTPEPSTTALSLLAAGAAGVEALRRRGAAAKTR
ncbi:MAG TPA: PEP-CTERM sorting domain-containing protein [Bryobacteraceae bacterium]|nr:PEP-CTERM sorting domain-containing protein [Bryobacteraceae bacterium]